MIVQGAGNLAWVGNASEKKDPGDQDGDANRVLTHLLWSLVAKRFASNRTLRNFHYVPQGKAESDSNS